MIKRMVGTRKCTICKREIEAYEEIIGRRCHIKSVVSDQGVFWNTSDHHKAGYWFCNSCWEKVRRNKNNG